MSISRVGRASIVGALVASAALLASSSASSRAAVPVAKAKEQQTQAQLVRQSRRESGLVVYGNPPAANFKVLTEAFRRKYPWINVTSYDLDNNVIFSKYASEAAQGSRTADILISSAPNLWVYARRQNYVLGFTPTGIASFPRFVRQYRGIYVLSPDPAIVVYNKLLLRDKVPNSLAEIAGDPSTYSRVTGYTVDNLFGYTGLWGYVQKRGWGNLQRIGSSRFRATSGVAAQLQLLSQGAATVAYLTSPTARFTIASNSQLSNLLAWTYLRDATPLVPRGIGITRRAASPASAKLFLNYVYSREGQQTMCEAGFTAFRLNFRPRNCSNTLADVYQKVGRRNVIFVPFSQKFVNDQPRFRARWHQIFG